MARFLWYYFTSYIMHWSITNWSTVPNAPSTAPNWSSSQISFSIVCSLMYLATTQSWFYLTYSSTLQSVSSSHPPDFWFLVTAQFFQLATKLVYLCYCPCFLWILLLMLFGLVLAFLPIILYFVYVSTSVSFTLFIKPLPFALSFLLLWLRLFSFRLPNSTAYFYSRM